MKTVKDNIERVMKDRIAPPLPLQREENRDEGLNNEKDDISEEDSSPKR